MFVLMFSITVVGLREVQCHCCSCRSTINDFNEAISALFDLAIFYAKPAISLVYVNLVHNI